MKWLLVLLTVSACNPIPEAVRRNVVITTSEGRASGVIIQTNWILTNAHAVGEEMQVDNAMSKVVFRDENLDLALVVANTEDFVRLTFAQVKSSDYVFYVANPRGHVNTISQGNVLYTDFSHTVTNTMPMPGMSGGGLWNARGELVGLNVGMEGSNYGLLMADHIPGYLVKRFVEENLK